MFTNGIASLRTLVALSGAAGAAIVTLIATNAHATTCVAVDESRDNLNQSDRDGARTLFEESLHENGIESGRDNCTETWTLYHVKLGGHITVVVHSPRGDRKEQVRGLGELPGIYSQIVRSIQTGLVGSSESPAVTRKNVTDSQMEQPNRLPAESIWYMNLGYGASVASGLHGGPTIGFGKRWELDRVGIDLSFMNMTFYQEKDNSSDGVAGAWLKLGADYFFDAYGNYSPYVGAGLSLSSNNLHIDHREYSGWGLNAELAVGYELFRASTIRMLIQANASLPTYRLSTHDVIYDGTGINNVDASNKYAPIFGITLGLGWGRPRQVSIVKIRQED